MTVADGTSIDQVGFARTADGVCTWPGTTGPARTRRTCCTRRSRVSGTIGAAAPIQSGWTAFSNPARVNDPRAGSASSGAATARRTRTYLQQEINTALSPDGGATWALQPGQVNPDGAQAYASPISATVRNDGTHLPGLVRHARHLGRRRALADHAQLQLPGGPIGSTATTRTSPPTRPAAR